MKPALDPRTKILLLVILSIAHGIATDRWPLVLALMSLVLVLVHWNSFLKGAKIIALTSVILGLFIFGTNFVSQGIVFPTHLIYEYIRWVSLTSVTVILSTSMNILEVMSSLTWLKVPFGIALAFGVGLRFLPILASEAQRVFYIQSRNDNSLSFRNVRRRGLVRLLDAYVSPLIVSVIRKANSLVLSIEIQQLSKRMKTYLFNRMGFMDLGLLAVNLALLYLLFEV